MAALTRSLRLGGLNILQFDDLASDCGLLDHWNGRCCGGAQGARGDIGGGVEMIDWNQLARLVRRERDRLFQDRGGVDMTAAAWTMDALANVADSMATLPPAGRVDESQSR